MVRAITSEFVQKGKKYVEFAGLSTDSKPVKALLATGSLFLEVDTGDIYAFDEDNETWHKIGGLGGGK